MQSAFPLVSEQIEIQNLARDFARNEILPFSNIYERESLSYNNLQNKLFQSGLINTRLLEKFGGPGLSVLDTCLVIEELAYACCGVASAAVASELAITALSLGSSPKQELILPSLSIEPAFLAYAPASDRSLTVLNQSDAIIINGSLPVVLNADLTSLYIISCSSANTARRYFLVQKKDSKNNDIEAIHLSAVINALGLKANVVRKAVLANLKLEPSAEIAFSTENLSYFRSLSALIISAGAIGLAKRAYFESAKYAQERKTFGVPIAKHQSISFMLADMKTDLEAAQLLTYRAARLCDLGTPSAKLAACAQAYALPTSVKAATDAVQIFGGYGYTKDYPVEKLMRDAKTYQLYFGP